MSEVIQMISMSPEPGQRVEVRRRLWTVAEVDVSNVGERPSHLVSLVSLEDDSLGETLDVVWELEPDARVLERTGLPSFSGIDDWHRMEAFLDAVRWGTVVHADRSLLQAPFRSGITIEDHQLDPLVRAIDMARISLLIADDVGLGKTIEAGLVIQELLLRCRARTVLVLCPASLQIKWQEEMRDKFGLEFRIVDTNYLKWLRRNQGIHSNPWTSFPRLITSIDWAKSGEPLRLLRDVLPPTPTYPRRFDILVVDEAHNVAPRKGTNYLRDSQRTRLVRLLAPHFEHKLFLTATPHDGYWESFAALLELLDDRRFVRFMRPDPKQVKRVLVRRLKEELVDRDGNPIYPKRRLLPLEIDYTEEERAVHACLRDFTRLRLERVKDSSVSVGTRFVLKLLKKRLFSSPAAFRKTLQGYVEGLESSRRTATEVVDSVSMRRAIQTCEEDFSDDRHKEEVQVEAAKLVAKQEPPLTEEEKKLLEEMLDWAERNGDLPDSKAKAILEWIEEHLKDDEDNWNDDRVVLFTEYLDTLNWLHSILVHHGCDPSRIEVMRGGMSSDERERIKAAFQSHPSLSSVRILLATDVASEGIDLQNHCNKLIHVEIPWNPNVMEQRNGRIDRHGQRASEVLIWHPVGRRYMEGLDGIASGGGLEGDLEFLMKAVEKVNEMRRDLGSVAPVIETHIEEAMLGMRLDLDLERARERSRSARRMLASERRLLERIRRLHQRLLETKEELGIAPDRIERTVEVALNLAGQPPLEPIEHEDLPKGKVFQMPPLQGSWARCLWGLEHPLTKETRPMTFDHEVARGRDDVVLIHLNHPLVQMSLRLLRAEIWARDDVKRLHRVTIGSLPKDRIRDPVALVWFRLVVTGATSHRLHEELTLAGGYLRENRFKREDRVTLLESWFDEANPIGVSDLDERILLELKERYQRHVDDLLASVEARAKTRMEHVVNVLLRRKERDLRDVEEAFAALREDIERELETNTTEVPRQLSLWSREEVLQRERDLEDLRHRLARIPEEMEREMASIQRRYEDLTHHTFPVSVTILVPEFMLATKEGA